MGTYEDDYGDFGPIRLTPEELTEVYRKIDAPTKDYGTDVDRFNAEHKYADGCRLGRYPGSDYTECDTHHAFVKHGVPAILRDI